jgi:hypothetical protein
LSRIESLPNYGVHYYAVTDKRNTPWYLGISYKGIAQYDYADRRQPRRVIHDSSSNLPFFLLLPTLESSRRTK